MNQSAQEVPFAEAIPEVMAEPFASRRAGLTVNRSYWLVPLVLLVILGVLLFANHRHASDRGAAAKAQAVVDAHVAQMFTYNYKTITQQLASEQNWLTGNFRDSYAQLASKQVVPVAVPSQLVTTASVASSGIISSSHNHVQVLIFLDVTTTSNKLAQPRLTGSRVVVSAEYVGGAWLISNMTTV